MGYAMILALSSLLYHFHFTQNFPANENTWEQGPKERVSSQFLALSFPSFSLKTRRKCTNPLDQRIKSQEKTTFVPYFVLSLSSLLLPCLGFLSRFSKSFFAIIRSITRWIKWPRKSLFYIGHEGLISWNFVVGFEEIEQRLKIIL